MRKKSEMRIGVLPTKMQPGADALSDDVPAQIILDISDVFETPFEGDAHFTCYQPVGNYLQDEWPRLNKPVLPRMRTLDADLGMNMIVMDYDNPGHLPWANKEQVLDFLVALEYVAKEFPIANEWTCFYTTKHGARLVYVLDEALLPEEYEEKHQWLCQQLNNHGLEVDLSVSDWTRCYRAPFVIRDGDPSWEDPCFVLKSEWDRTLDHEKLGKAARNKTSEYAEIISFKEDIPDSSIRIDILFEISPESGNSIKSEWHKTAKRRLRGRECSEVLFGQKLLADRGDRNTSIHKYVGQVVSLLYYFEGTTPQHIYALFLEAVGRLEPDRDTPDWSVVLWDHICRLWAKEDAKARKQKEIEEQQLEVIEGKISTVVKGVRNWSDNKDLHSNDPQAVGEFLERRMIAQHGRSYFPMLPTGHYSNDSLLGEQIIPWIRSHEMDGLIQTQTEDGDVDRTMLINKYAYPVKEVTGLPQIEGGYITDDDRLVISLYRRNPKLTPLYSEVIDEWLMHLFGEHYMTACSWIGNALAFEEGPICALSIKGDPGVGKKLLIQGLAECLENPWVAEAEDITSAYQYGLMKSPFLAVNEGWPVAKSRHPADTFRRLVGGDGLLANQKFHAPVRIKNPVRIIFAANNLDVVGFLTGGRDLSPEDREALQIRLLHFNVGDEAAMWLRARGGLKFTGGWIEGDGGRPSDYVLARHFLYLHATRANYGLPGSRFLVEGRQDSGLMFEMRTQSGNGPLVVEAIIKLLNYKNTVINKGIVVQDRKLFVLASEILDFYRGNMAQSTKGESLSARTIGNVLKGLVEYESHNAFVLESRSAMGRKRWHQVDPEMLQNAAQRDGWLCNRLDELVEDRARMNGTKIAQFRMLTQEQEQ